jgi:hypothetical protein
MAGNQQLLSKTDSQEITVCASNSEMRHYLRKEAVVGPKEREG